LNGLVSHAVRDTDGFVYLRQRLSQLAHDAGLDLFATLPGSLPPAERLRTALRLAAERHRNSATRRCSREPSAAIKPLASTLLAALGTIAFSSDQAAFAELPSLAPLSPLSPALFVVDQIAQGLGARISARSEDAMAIYERLLLRLNQPDRAGLQFSEHLVTVLRITLSIGALEASLGLKRCLDRIAVVQREPEYETQTLMLRQLHQLWQGHGDAAAETQHMIELRKGANAHHGFEGQHLLSELCAQALSDDLTRVKHATDTAASHARVHVAWIPVLHYGRGEYHRIRGDGLTALSELRVALTLMAGEKHQLWVNAAGAELRVLVELRRYAEAVARGRQYLLRSRELGLGFAQIYLRMPLSLALSATGEIEAAELLAQSVIDELQALGSTGLNLALAHEARARVALAADDGAAFQRHATSSAEQWRGGAVRLLGARYAQRAVEAGAGLNANASHDGPPSSDEDTQPRKLLRANDDEQELARRAPARATPATPISLSLDSQVASFSSFSILATPPAPGSSDSETSELRRRAVPISSLEP
jgi:hypothetical protein